MPPLHPTIRLLMQSDTDVAELNRRLGLPGLAEVEVAKSGLPRVRIGTPQCSGEIYLHGAHVTSWRPAGSEEVFFLSSASLFRDGKAIRGGIPLCFPWFGNRPDAPKAPAHGLVRTRSWNLDSISHENDAVSVTMSLEYDGSAEEFWPDPFRVSYRVTFGSVLSMDLVAINPSSHTQRFEEAQHVYYRIGDVSQAKISGLNGTHYLDKVDSFREKLQSGDFTACDETDRVYLDTERELTIDDPVLRRRIVVRKQNSRTTVVWNPWQQKAAGLGDLGEGEWAKFVCLETSNVERYAIEVASGQSHTMTTTVRVESY